MIPKIIHFCWFGGKPIPQEVKKCIESWKKICPDYEIKKWDESNFDINAHPFVKAAYEAKSWAFVSDYARLKVGYENGGIYLDTDVELVKSIDFLRTNPFYIGVQQEPHLCTTGLGFGAEKNNSIVKEMLEEYDKNSFSSNKEEQRRIACPYLNDYVLKRRGITKYSNEIIKTKDMVILPSKMVDPYAPGKNTKNLFCDETISIHHYSASWESKEIVLRRKIIRFLGPKHVNNLKRILRYGK